MIFSFVSWVSPRPGCGGRTRDGSTKAVPSPVQSVLEGASGSLQALRSRGAQLLTRNPSINPGLLGLARQRFLPFLLWGVAGGSAGLLSASTPRLSIQPSPEYGW